MKPPLNPTLGDAAQQTVSTGQRYRYTGKPFDDEGAFDLYYYGARYYDPELGRFIAVDPLAKKHPGWSPYAYCLNNPLRFVDPDGMTEQERTMALERARQHVEQNKTASAESYEMGGWPGSSDPGIGD